MINLEVFCLTFGGALHGNVFFLSETQYIRTPYFHRRQSASYKKLNSAYYRAKYILFKTYRLFKLFL